METNLQNGLGLGHKQNSKTGKTLLWIASFALVLGLAGTGLYFFVLNNPSGNDAPPSLQFEGGMGFIGTGTYLQFTDTDVLAASTKTFGSTIPAGVQALYSNSDITLRQVIDAIKPDKTLNIMFAYYNAESKKFDVYPKGPYSNSNLIDDDKLNQYTVEAHTGFFLIASKAFEVSSAVKFYSVAPTNTALNKTNWNSLIDEYPSNETDSQGRPINNWRLLISEASVIENSCPGRVIDVWYSTTADSNGIKFTDTASRNGYALWVKIRGETGTCGDIALGDDTVVEGEGDSNIVTINILAEIASANLLDRSAEKLASDAEGLLATATTKYNSIKSDYEALNAFNNSSISKYLKANTLDDFNFQPIDTIQNVHQQEILDGKLLTPTQVLKEKLESGEITLTSKSYKISDFILVFLKNDIASIYARLGILKNNLDKEVKNARKEANNAKSFAEAVKNSTTKQNAQENLEKTALAEEAAHGSYENANRIYISFFDNVDLYEELSIKEKETNEPATPASDPAEVIPEEAEVTQEVVDEINVDWLDTTKCIYLQNGDYTRCHAIASASTINVLADGFKNAVQDCIAVPANDTKSKIYNCVDGKFKSLTCTTDLAKGKALSTEENALCINWEGNVQEWLYCNEENIWDKMPGYLCDGSIWLKCNNANTTFNLQNEDKFACTTLLNNDLTPISSFKFNWNECRVAITGKYTRNEQYICDGWKGKWVEPECVGGEVSDDGTNICVNNLWKECNVDNAYENIVNSLDSNNVYYCSPNFIDYIKNGSGNFSDITWKWFYGNNYNVIDTQSFGDDKYDTYLSLSINSSVITVMENGNKDGWKNTTPSATGQVKLIKDSLNTVDFLFYCGPGFQGLVSPLGQYACGYNGTNYQIWDNTNTSNQYDKAKFGLLNYVEDSTRDIICKNGGLKEDNCLSTLHQKDWVVCSSLNVGEQVNYLTDDFWYRYICLKDTDNYIWFFSHDAQDLANKGFLPAYTNEGNLNSKECNIDKQPIGSECASANDTYVCSSSNNLEQMKLDNYYYICLDNKWVGKKNEESTILNSLWLFPDSNSTYWGQQGIKFSDHSFWHGCSATKNNDVTLPVGAVAGYPGDLYKCKNQDSTWGWYKQL